MAYTPSLSVCMIVRDEEAHLHRAIESVLPVANEIIVVDTGSRDRTIEIAQELGAKVSTHLWQDDFSLARNASIEAASGDWILSLDADQWLDQDAIAALTEALRRPCLAQRVKIDLVAENKVKQPFNSYWALRLFRRDPRIRFSGRVHEGVADSLLAIGAGDWPESGLVLLDDGYALAADRQRKLARNLSLLELAWQQQPDDLFLSYKLAVTLPAERRKEQEALLLNSMDKARQLSLDALGDLPFLPSLLAAAVGAYVNQGRLDEAAESAKQIGPQLGGSSLFTAGRAAARAGQLRDAESLLTRFLADTSGPANPAAQPDLDANPAEACAWLGWLSLQAGDLATATLWLERGLLTATMLQAVAIGCNLIRVSLATGDLGEAAQGLELLYPRAAGSAEAHSELMLISAELAMAASDVAGALQLATAALTPEDDRAAALLTEIALSQGTTDLGRLDQLLSALPGRRFDTLAWRCKLEKQLDLAKAIKCHPLPG